MHHFECKILAFGPGHYGQTLSSYPPSVFFHINDDFELFGSNSLHWWAIVLNVILTSYSETVFIAAADFKSKKHRNNRPVFITRREMLQLSAWTLLVLAKIGEGAEPPFKGYRAQDTHRKKTYNRPEFNYCMHESLNRFDSHKNV